MKIKEMIEVLSRLDPEAEVIVSANKYECYPAQERDFRLQEVDLRQDSDNTVVKMKALLLPWWISGVFKTEIKEERICPKCNGSGKIMKIKTV